MFTSFEIQPEVLAQCTRFDPEVYSDLHKDAHGFRPRVGLGDRTAAQLDALMDNTSRAASEACDHERQMARAARAGLDSLLDDLQNDMHVPRATALRWLVEAEDCRGDLDSFCFAYGLDFSEAPALAQILEGNQ